MFGSRVDVADGRSVAQPAAMPAEPPASAPRLTRRPLFSCAGTSEVAVSDVRLAADGAATIAAAARPGSKLGFCSVLLGVDCFSLHVTCCYCLDEFVDGALFDAPREHVVVWKRAAGALVLHVFQVGAPAGAALVRRFRAACRSHQRLERIGWHGDRVALWIGAPDGEAELSTFQLRPATGEAPRAADDGDERAEEPSPPLDASGLGRDWEAARAVDGARAHDLRGAELSADASWALLRVDGAVAALHLPSAAAASPIVLDGSVCACFGARCTEASCDLFSLQRAGGERGGERGGAVLELLSGRLVRGANRPGAMRRVEVPWLGALAVPAASQVVRLAVACDDARTPLAVWVHTVAADGTAAVSGAAAAFVCHEDLGDAPMRVALSGRGFAAEAGGEFSVAAALRLDAPADDLDGVALPAWRSLHWAGTVKRAQPAAGGAAHPAADARFSFAGAVREHLSFGPHLVAQLLRPAGGPAGAWRCGPHLETQRLLSLGWDRTADGGDWPDGQPRFFRYGRYRLQNLSQRPDLAARVPADPGLVMTDSMASLATRLLEGYKHDQPVLLEGEAAGGKTAAVQFCAHATNSPLLQFNMTPSTTIADFEGALGLANDSFAFCLGPLAEAVKDGLWLLLEGANLASDAVLRVVEDVLTSGYLRLSSGGISGQAGTTSGQLTVPRHPNFRLFITQNSADDIKYGTTRHTLSASLLSHFVPVVAPAMEPEHMRYIVASKLCATRPRTPTGEPVKEIFSDPSAGRLQITEVRPAAIRTPPRPRSESPRRAPPPRVGESRRPSPCAAPALDLSSASAGANADEGRSRRQARPAACGAVVRLGGDGRRCGRRQLGRRGRDEHWRVGERVCVVPPLRLYSDPRRREGEGALRPEEASRAASVLRRRVCPPARRPAAHARTPTPPPPLSGRAPQELCDAARHAPSRRAHRNRSAGRSRLAPPPPCPPRAAASVPTSRRRAPHRARLFRPARRRRSPAGVSRCSRASRPYSSRRYGGATRSHSSRS